MQQTSNIYSPCVFKGREIMLRTQSDVWKSDFWQDFDISKVYLHHIFIFYFDWNDFHVQIYLIAKFLEYG